MVQRLRKTKKGQKFNYSRNRKRLGQKTRRNGTIKCPEIRAAYDVEKNPAHNIRDMGLAYDVNRGAVPMPNVRRQIKEMAQELDGKKFRRRSGTQTSTATKRRPAPKQYVADQLEQDANELRENRFRMAKSCVHQITTMLDRYGFDYGAMVRDRRNYEQETWRQFRAKIRRFLRIPEQCTPYLEQKGWIDCDMSDPDDPRWKEYCTDDEV